MAQSHSPAPRDGSLSATDSAAAPASTGPAPPDALRIGALRAEPANEQIRRGYFHTLREILQQPATWIDTAARVAARRGALDALLDAAGVRSGSGSILLTGSGSSLYAGECGCVGLQHALGVPVRAVVTGEILLQPSSVVPQGRSLIVSVSRSGNSPESAAAVDLVLKTFPASRHLVVTPNPAGLLATAFRGTGAVEVLLLAERICDRSLAMTSSFTNLILAVRGFAMPGGTDAYLARAAVLARAGDDLLRRHADALACVAHDGFDSVLFLGTAARFGAARECALKALELSDGAVATMAETYLGLRHGPMASLSDRTLVVCLLGVDPVVRAYEHDLIRELNRKGLGARRVLVGCAIPDDIVRPQDLVVDCPALAGVEEADLPIVQVIVGQLLAFFRCLEIGLAPDAPSPGGVINRVVESFTLHART